MPAPPIDRNKVRALVSKLDEEGIYVLLDRAIELLPKSKLAKLIEGYAWPNDLRDDGAPTKSLVAQITDFHTASVRGDYYEDFLVNSKNFMDKSRGTRRFIADYCRLLDACASASRRPKARAHARKGFELLFNLLDRIDECRDDIVFFADEAGSWQVGVDWRRVLLDYARCLSEMDPEDFAARIVQLVEQHAAYDRDRILEQVGRVASKARKMALRHQPG